MVLYRVYSEPHLVKHYSTVCSRATLFQVLFYAVIIIAPFFIAYATNGKPEKSYILISAHFTRITLPQIYGNILVHTESNQTYISSTSGLYKSPVLTNPVDRGVLMRDTTASLDQQSWPYPPSKWPLITLTCSVTVFMICFMCLLCLQFHEDDFNYDRLNDRLSLTLQFAELGCNVSAVQIMLLFELQLSVSKATCVAIPRCFWIGRERERERERERDRGEMLSYLISLPSSSTSLGPPLWCSPWSISLAVGLLLRLSCGCRGN